MAHSLIIGATESGKSFLAKRLCQTYRKKGMGTLVLDPNGEGGWDCDFRTDDPERFLAVAKRSRCCALFVDEAGAVFSRERNDPMQWVTTRSRHNGHFSFLIGQRFDQIPPTTRNNCANLFLFIVSRTDSRYWADQFADEELAKAFQLPRYHFYQKMAGKSAQMSKI